MVLEKGVDVFRKGKRVVFWIGLFRNGVGYIFFLEGSSGSGF